MNVYKLGTRWGKNAPDFYNLIRNEQISLSHINDCSPKKNEIILIAKGFKIVAITLLQEDTHPVTDFPELEQKFTPFNIHYDQYVTFAKSSWYELKTEDQFEYKTQDGICQVQKYEVIQITKDLLLKYQNKEKMKKNSSLLHYKKQIILQGPPGTGKTRLAKEIAVEMLGLNDTKELENNNQFKLIQFHPSYTYEDFVRGIIAKPSEDGEGILYEAENKTLGLFAKKALKNYNETNDISIDSSIGMWVDETFEDFKNEIETNLTDKEFILSGEISIYKVQKKSFLYGKNWISGGHIKFEEFKKLVKAIIKKEISLGTTLLDKDKFVHSHYRSTYYNALLKKFFDKYHYTIKTINIPPKNYVLIIDEINRANLSSVLGELIYALEYRGKAVESMYDVDGNDLILPPNLYIIGTMNTADRSVGHIDYAIRRRFAFIDVLPESLEDDDHIHFNTEGFKKVSDLFKNGNVSGEFEAKDVQLGHSYFIAKKEDLRNDQTKEGIFRMKMNYEVVPILLEYVKDGVLIGTFKDKNNKDWEIKEYINNLKINN